MKTRCLLRTRIQSSTQEKPRTHHSDGVTGLPEVLSERSDFRTLLSPDCKLLAWSECDPARSWGLICARQFAWLENLSWVDGLGKTSLSLFLISSLIVSFKFNSVSTALRHHITLGQRSGIIARFSSRFKAHFLLLPVSFLPLVRPRSWNSAFSHCS